MLILGRARRRVPLRHSFTWARRYAVESRAVTYGRDQDFALHRDLLVDVLSTNVTKRDAKQFLARCKPSKSGHQKYAGVRLATLLQQQYDGRFQRSQNRDGGLSLRQEGSYGAAQEGNASTQGTVTKVTDQPVAIDERTSRQAPQQRLLDTTVEPSLSTATLETELEHTHLALICFRCPNLVEDSIIDGFAVTISQLVKLGMQIVIVVDCNPPEEAAAEDHPHDFKAFRAKLSEQVDRLSRAIEKHSSKGVQAVSSALEWTGADSNLIAVALPDQLLHPLERGRVVLVPSMAYTASGQSLPAASKDVMTELTRQLCSARLGDDSVPVVDRVFIIDPVGGIPSKNRRHGARVNINLEQEFESITRELSEWDNLQQVNVKQHRDNLDLVRKCLALLPRASSGLILSPAAAANSSQNRTSPGISIGKDVRQKNVLIHNLLTNKPLISSSLPIGRLLPPADETCDTSSTVLPATTLIKRGMPLTIIPAQEGYWGWQRPANGVTALKLEDDPKIDFTRLVHLINDSFRRQLDVSDYLKRIKNRVAGVVVAGNYEGGAIFTWEMPPHTQDPGRLVPYLDKFAVLQSSQGSSGVADLLFQEMVQTCFPHGVCWRSRKNNPVNKWYFERATGSWQIPNSDWTMFWTGDGPLAQDRWMDYVTVCTSIRPSWADGEKPD